MTTDILVVDDEPDIRDLISGVLEDEGYAVRSAATAEKALEEVRMRAPGLVILDVWLQGSDMDGLSLLKFLKSIDPLIPVIVISGHGNIETAVAAIRRGAYDFIEKPFKSDRLIHLVERALESTALKRENASLRNLVISSDDWIGNSHAATTLRTAIDKVNIYVVKDNERRLLMFKNGEVDFFSMSPTQYRKEVMEGEDDSPFKNGDYQLTKFLRLAYRYIGWNQKSDLFKDKRVREAFAYAINRESIVKNLVGEAAEVINTPCHPDQVACVQDVTGRSYDPEKAKALLKEAGAEGLEFDIYAYRQREFTEAVISDLAKVGVKAKLNFMQYRKLRGLAQNGVTPVHHMTWGSYSIPDASACAGVFFSGGKDDPANDPKVNELINKAGNVTDLAERKKLYKEAFQIISDNVYWLPMFTYAKNYAYNKDLSIETTSDEIPRFYTAKWK